MTNKHHDDNKDKIVIDYSGAKKTFAKWAQTGSSVMADLLGKSKDGLDKVTTKLSNISEEDTQKLKKDTYKQFDKVKQKTKEGASSVYGAFKEEVTDLMDREREKEEMIQEEMDTIYKRRERVSKFDERTIHMTPEEIEVIDAQTARENDDNIDIQDHPNKIKDVKED